jgi:hypothetical protein
LFDRDEEVAPLLETIFEMIVADDLYGVHLHAAPVRGLMPDGLGGRKVDHRRRAIVHEQALIPM